MLCRDASVQHRGVQSRQRGRPRRERLDRRVARVVQVPDVDGAGALCLALDFLFGRLALRDGADGDDYFGGSHAHEVLGGLETEADVGAGDDDGHAGEVIVGVRRFLEELSVDVVEERHDGGQGRKELAIGWLLRR